MGMFDTIEWQYPWPEKTPQYVQKIKGWQTKDLESMLDEYVVTKAGVLRIQTWVGTGKFEVRELFGKPIRREIQVRGPSKMVRWSGKAELHGLVYDPKAPKGVMWVGSDDRTKKDALGPFRARSVTFDAWFRQGRLVQYGKPKVESFLYYCPKAKEVTFLATKDGAS